MFDLQNDIVQELPVKLLEVVVGSGSPVVFEIAPIHVMVIDETPVKDQTAVAGQGPGDDIRGVSMAAMINGGAQPPLRVGLENKASKIGNRAVDSIDRFLPEIGDARVQR